MKCIEENRINPRDNSETFRFTIIGDRGENTTKIPLWEQSFTITDIEKIQLCSRCKNPLEKARVRRLNMAVCLKCQRSKVKECRERFLAKHPSQVYNININSINK